MTELQSHILNKPEAWKEIFDNAHDLIHIVDPSGRILYANDSWRRILGFVPADISGKSIYSVIDADDRDRFQQYRQKILDSYEDGTEIIIALRGKNGKKIFVEGFLSRRILDGRMLYTTGTFRDITLRLQNEKELKLINEQLKEREANLKGLLFNAPDAVVVIDKESIVSYWNPKAEAIFGWVSDEAIGRSITDLIIPDKYKDAHVAGMARYLQTGEGRVLNKSIEITAIDKSKKEFYVSLTISTTYQKGEIAFIAFLRDIDEQKRMERELDDKRAQLESSNRELEQFAYVASHDMKEPVRKIRTFVERLRLDHGEKFSENAENYVNKIDGAACRLFDIVDGVLAYSSMKSEKAVIEQVDLNQVIDDVEKDLDNIVESKGATIKSDPLPTVEGSRFLLFQLFYNLLGNSLKFSRPDVRPVIEISFSKYRDSSLIEISIADNGIGFSQGYAEAIFDAFTRLNSKSHYEGSGLGLSICKRIVEKHGGSITAFGNENSGSTFVIRLPERQGTH